MGRDPVSPIPVCVWEDLAWRRGGRNSFAVGTLGKKACSSLVDRGKDKNRKVAQESNQLCVLPHELRKDRGEGEGWRQRVGPGSSGSLVCFPVSSPGLLAPHLQPSRWAYFH